MFAKLGFPILLEKKYFSPQPYLSDKIKKILSSEKNIGIAPFASHLGKEYPFYDMENDVIHKLSENFPNSKIFIFGGGNHQKQLVEKISTSLPNVENMIGAFSFQEELQLISRLDIMVAMDSGNAHLSAMYGVPTVTLWGVTHPFAGFYPYEQPKENALLADREKFKLIPTFD